ncbi:hypothetical protein FOA52_015258 [Chlamydomonas sp. UWO 241]|nr:hypothetical protein FOA52_015258 [Chlamydomonas sp. UWO 241]
MAPHGWLLNTAEGSQMVPQRRRQRRPPAAALPAQLLLLLAPLLLLLLAVTAAEAIDVDSRTRSEWRALETICPNRNYTSCKAVDKAVWSVAEKTQVAPLNFTGLNSWSSFNMTTHDAGGARRTRGGDSWYVVLRDRQHRVKVPTRVFDDGDGSYTVVAYFMMPGEYALVGMLWYSDCFGLQEPNEPPEGRTGEYAVSNANDGYYSKVLAKADHCYVGGKVRIAGVLTVPASAPPPCFAASQQQQQLLGSPAVCGSYPPAPTGPTGTPIFRMETYYYRQNHTYQEATCCKPRFPKPAHTVSRFMVYGDSTFKNSWELLLYQARQPCNITWKPRHVFETLDIHGGPDSNICPRVKSLEEVDPKIATVLKRCTAGAPWSSVPVGSNTNDVSKYIKNALTFDMQTFQYNSTFATTPNIGGVAPIGLPVPREFSLIYLNGWGSVPFDFVKAAKAALVGVSEVVNAAAQAASKRARSPPGKRVCFEQPAAAEPSAAPAPKPSVNSSPSPSAAPAPKPSANPSPAPSALQAASPKPTANPSPAPRAPSKPSANPSPLTPSGAPAPANAPPAIFTSGPKPSLTPPVTSAASPATNPAARPAKFSKRGQSTSPARPDARPAARPSTTSTAPAAKPAKPAARGRSASPLRALNAAANAVAAVASAAAAALLPTSPTPSAPASPTSTTPAPSAALAAPTPATAGSPSFQGWDHAAGTADSPTTPQNALTTTNAHTPSELSNPDTGFADYGGPSTHESPAFVTHKGKGSMIEAIKIREASAGIGQRITRSITRSMSLEQLSPSGPGVGQDQPLEENGYHFIWSGDFNAKITAASPDAHPSAQAQQIASLVDVVSLLVSRVPGAPMQMPHAEPARARAGHAAHSAAPRAAPAVEAAQPARPAAAAAPVASAGGGLAAEWPASGATRAASARGPSRREELPARVGDTSLRRSFVLSIPVARGANWFLAGGGRRMDEEEATAAAAERIAAAAEDGTSLPVRLATDVVRFLYGGTGRREPADGGVVSASLLNAKPAVGGIGVEPRGGGVLRVLFTVASDAVADTVVRWRHELRRCVDSTAVFDVLSDREEAQHQALWPAFLAAKVAGKRAQFHRARLVVDGERHTFDPDVITKGDVVVVNMGPHYTRCSTFEEWRDLIDKTAELFKLLISQGAVMVWRTSFLIKEHVFRSYSHADGYVPQAHFNTDHRRLMFDSYAEDVLLAVGVPMWDVTGMSSMGDYVPHDMWVQWVGVRDEWVECVGVRDDQQGWDVTA